MKQYILPLTIYFTVISIISVYITVKDKKAAINNNRRISENTLMLFGIMGGAFAMLVTMKKIRHKTKHLKFMVGLPLEFIFQIIIIIYLLEFFKSL